jgi:hypothetical protein
MTIDYRQVKLAVCIPARDQMHTATSFCLYNLANVLTELGIDNKLFISPGTLIANQRHELVKSAKDWSATHVMFIDSDIEFQPYHVTNLLDFDESIVGAAYSKRVEPFLTTAWKEIDKWSTYVRPLEQTESHIKIAAMGLGFCLIKIEVFDKINLPWFQLGFTNGQYTGEDIEFFRKCKDVVDIWLDVQTTCELGHLGTKSYKVDGGIDVDLET